MAGELLDICEDVDRYNKAFFVYDKFSERLTKEKQWCKVGFVENVLPLLDVELDDGEDFCSLGVGSGTGEVETHILKQLLGQFPHISNHVVEPSKELMTKYKMRVSEDSSGLKSIDYHWHQMSFEDYKENQMEEAICRKFHFISAVHSLYYFDDFGKWMDYMYGLLADGGVLLIIIAAETSGYGNIHREFPTFGKKDTEFSNLHTGNVKKYLDKNHISYNHGIIPMKINITSCLSDTPSDEGDLLLDFFTHCIDFRKNIDEKLRKRFIHFLNTNQCTEKESDSVFLKTDCGFIAVQKKENHVK